MPKTPTKSPARPQRSPKKLKEPAPALYRATVKSTAINKSEAIKKIDPSTSERIKKCLQKAHHHGTGQSEMDAAMLLAKKLMTHIVALTRAEESKNPDRTAKKGVEKQGWVAQLAYAMSTFFDCKSYSRKKAYSIDIVFYVLAPNTVAAAHAFEMTFNLTSEWARNVESQGNAKSAKYAYCLGIAPSLAHMADAEKVAEAELARDPEAELDEAKIGGGDDDEDMDDVVENGSDSEDEVDNRSMIERLISPQEPMRKINRGSVLPFTPASSPVKQQTIKDPEPKSVWASSTQLRMFSANATKIAEDYLEEQEVTFSKKKVKQTEVKDKEAYKQGTVDDKTIDVRGKKIEG